jgi:hypothetical protein
MGIKITINKLLTCLFTLLLAISVSAQDKDKKEVVKHKPSIMLGVAGLKYQGYIGSHSNLSPLLDARMGYFLAVEQRFGKVLGVELGGMYGKLAGTDNQTTTSGTVTTQYFGNFQSQVIQGQLMLTLNFDGVMKGDPAVSPFIKAGIGYMMFTPYSDLKDANNHPYIYESDGSIVYAQTTVTTTPPATVTTFVPTKRDYTYETKVSTSQTGCLVIPTMAGFDFTFGKHMTFLVGAGYTFCLSSWVDGTGKGSSAGYISANAGLKYEFGKKVDAADKQYENVDFASVDHLDADKDGVPDDKDMCHGTPKGVKVDEKGCPLDSDNDGVPDYLDHEANTAKGNKVDGYGVTIDEAALAQHQKDWDNQAPERSKQFNVLPSKAYLEKVAADAKKNQANLKAKGGNTTNKIPAELRSADINNDGFISADEITKTIDSFFEGSGDFTVEKINKLIDYFFEQ